MQVDEAAFGPYHHLVLALLGGWVGGWMWMDRLGGWVDLGGWVGGWVGGLPCCPFEE